MKVLVLGAEGFIGHHLVNYFSDKVNEVYGADLYEAATAKYHYHKITRLSPEYDELLQLAKFDVCINAAGSGNVNYSMTHPVSDFESNSLDTIRILDGLRRHQPVCKYVHISSAAVYGNPSELPVSEAHSLNPISAYGWHKLISEKICKEYSSIYKVPTVIVRPFSVFGPGLKKQLFWDLFQKCSKDATDRPIQLWGSGRESRDFIYIDDVVLAFDKIIERGSFQSEEYNIASGTETPIKNAAANLLKHLGIDRPLNFNGYERLGDPQNWRADVNKINRLGFYPSFTLEEGLKRVGLWMKSQS